MALEEDVVVSQEAAGWILEVDPDERDEEQQLPGEIGQPPKDVPWDDDGFQKVMVVARALGFAAPTLIRQQDTTVKKFKVVTGRPALDGIPEAKFAIAIVIRHSGERHNLYKTYDKLDREAASKVKAALLALELLKGGESQKPTLLIRPPADLILQAATCSSLPASSRHLILRWPRMPFELKSIKVTRTRITASMPQSSSYTCLSVRRLWVLILMPSKRLDWRVMCWC